MAVQVTGMKTVLRNLNREIGKIENRTGAGIQSALTFVEGESNETVPQRKGVLINSSFTQMTGPLQGVVGYTALHAPFVHEMPESYNFTKPDTGPKFLEKPIRSEQRTILKIIHNRARIR